MLAQEVYQKLQATLVEALNVDEEEITPATKIQGDLGAESIDFLDIIFRLEREFKIKIPRGELFPEHIFERDPEFVQNIPIETQWGTYYRSRITPKGIVELRRRMPNADLAEIERDPSLERISDLFTVDMVYKYLCAKLDIPYTAIK